MAVTCGFFDAIDHDRLYNAEDFGSLFDGVIKDGILNSYGDHFAVAHSSGLNVVVGSGKGWFKNTWIKNNSNLTLTAEHNTSGAARIDTVVIDVDKRDSVRANNIIIVQGTNTRPVLINESAHKQYPLADITIDPTGATISGVTDRRTESYASYLLSEQLRPYWPIGSIYMSVNNIEPSTLFGGTWERLSGRFLLGCDSTFPNGSTGGSWNHQITVNHMPAHTHGVGNLTANGATVDMFTYRLVDGKTGVTFMGWPDGAREKTNSDLQNHVTASWDYPYGYQGVQSPQDQQVNIGPSKSIVDQITISQNAHSHSITGYTESSGSGNAMDIKPPYLAVYMWKRTG